MTDAHCLGHSAGAQNEYSVMAVHAQPCAYAHVVHENGTRGSLFVKKRKTLHIQPLPSCMTHHNSVFDTQKTDGAHQCTVRAGSVLAQDIAECLECIVDVGIAGTFAHVPHAHDFGG